ncbi:enterochelin esterase [Spirilliplanes yamanashiensis]|uniref:Enterochelin esterase n=1 Tax=Spirilliplanes yamanashiensis TaxID=42233 RepID=A0A8J3Y5X0_9ACTN|nr:enterochelin esterase [Spirilliplanes yamanashiensis]
MPRSSVPPRIPRPTPAPLAVSPRVEALRADPSTVDDFWAGVPATPLVEPGPDGDVLLTFLWRERRPTHAVLALVNKLTDRHDLAASSMARVPGTGVWHLTYRVRDDWLGSYQLAPDEGDTPADLRDLAARGIPDPRNPDRLPPARSVAAAPGADRPEWWRPRPGTPAGALDTVTVDDRRVWRYAPPGYDAAAGPYPLLVLLDGDVWGPALPVAPMLDNLIAAGLLPPLVALLPDSVDRPTRFTEYACQASTVEFLCRLPVLCGLNVTADPARTVVAGQSLGGLMAAFAGLLAPWRFGAVLAQSGAFWWPSTGEPERLTRSYAVVDRRDLRFHLEVGLDEWVNVGPNRRLRDILVEGGYPVTYAEFAGGHDRACWRERLPAALIGLYA